MQTPKLVITGRDGILNFFRSDHVKAPEEWQPIPGALEAVARLNHAGWHVVVATNQSGIGRGMIDMTSVNAVHQHMMKLLSEKGGRIDAVFFCPHAATEQCDCRKPAPGLLRRAARDLSLDLASCVMVGGDACDVQAGRAAGVAACIRIVDAIDPAAIAAADPPADYTCTRLAEAARWLLEHEQTRSA